MKNCYLEWYVPLFAFQLNILTQINILHFLFLEFHDKILLNLLLNNLLQDLSFQVLKKLWVFNSKHDFFNHLLHDVWKANQTQSTSINRKKPYDSADNASV